MFAGGGAFEREEEGRVRLSDLAGTSGEDSVGTEWSIGVEFGEAVGAGAMEVGVFVAD